MDIPCWQELVQYGADQVIQREYAQWVTETEPEYAVSLLIDLDKVPEEGGEFGCSALLCRPFSA